jgi:hypothetical protein
MAIPIVISPPNSAFHYTSEEASKRWQSLHEPDPSLASEKVSFTATKAVYVHREVFVSYSELANKAEQENNELLMRIFGKTREQILGSH